MFSNVLGTLGLRTLPPHFPAILTYRKGLSQIFFRLYRANFDDLRPLKPEFDTFEHLWGSKTWFRAPEISWFLLRKMPISTQIFGFSGPKVQKKSAGGLRPPNPPNPPDPPMQLGACGAVRSSWSYRTGMLNVDVIVLAALFLAIMRHHTSCSRTLRCPASAVRTHRRRILST